MRRSLSRPFRSLTRSLSAIRGIRFLMITWLSSLTNVTARNLVICIIPLLRVLEIIICLALLVRRYLLIMRQVADGSIYGQPSRRLAISYIPTRSLMQLLIRMCCRFESTTFGQFARRMRSMISRRCEILIVNEH